MTVYESEELTQKATDAMKVAATNLVKDHSRRHQPLAVWRDGKVVLEIPEMEQPLSSTKMPAEIH